MLSLSDPRKLLFAIALFVFTFPVYAQNSDALQKKQQKALQVVGEKAEIYLSINSITLYQNSELIDDLSIDYFQHGRAYVYSNKKALQQIIDRSLDFDIERSPGDVDFDLNMKSWSDLQNNDLIDNWDFYPTYEAYESLMQHFAEEFPDLCQVYNAGTLPSGRSLWFARITAGIDQEQAKPLFMYTSTMHGDETTGFVLSLRLIHYLLNNYGVLDDVTELLEGLEIWICPNENPDGTYRNDNATVLGATRSNLNGIDLNRNYPNPETGVPSNIQPETQAMMRLTDSLHFVMSANMHGGIECVNYPWDTWTSSEKTHADHYWWQLVSHEYADTARYYSPQGYMSPSGSSFYNGVTHGGDWYDITGSRQDYMNYYAHQRELTLELSNTKLLPPDQLPAYWEYNYRSLLNYMWQATYGISGMVSCAESGAPLEAKVRLESHDIDNSFVFSQLPLGDFYRPVLAGKYTIEVSAPGYVSFRAEDITIENYSVYTFDIQLSSESPDVLVQEHGLDSFLNVYPNPANDMIFLESEKPMNRIEVFDLSGRRMLSRELLTTGYSFSLNNFKEGVYIVNVYIGGGVVSKRFQVM